MAVRLTAAYLQLIFLNMNNDIDLKQKKGAVFTAPFFIIYF